MWKEYRVQILSCVTPGLHAWQLTLQLEDMKWVHAPQVCGHLTSGHDILKKKNKKSLCLRSHFLMLLCKSQAEVPECDLNESLYKSSASTDPTVYFEVSTVIPRQNLIWHQNPLLYSIIHYYYLLLSAFLSPFKLLKVLPHFTQKTLLHWDQQKGHSRNVVYVNIQFTELHRVSEPLLHLNPISISKKKYSYIIITKDKTSHTALLMSWFFVFPAQRMETHS